MNRIRVIESKRYEINAHTKRKKERKKNYERKNYKKKESSN